ncbi:MAG: glycosyltransferase [Acidobacteria bacterium]|nr:glycosyltransferase [Acidobacteriota bacterium]
MRILLAASASYAPPKGGSTRSNLVWLRSMAKAGHECLVLCGGVKGQETVVDGIRIRTHTTNGMGKAIAELEPDFVLVSSEDLSHSILREAHLAAKDRLIYLAHTPQWFPFGPEAWHRDPVATRMLDDALAIIAIGQHMAGYIEEHLGRTAIVVPPALYGDPPWPEYQNYSQQSVLIINPCTAKGLPIFLALAKRFPQRKFLALKGWGTTASDEVALRNLPNVEVLNTVPSIDEVFARTSVLVAPSLWYEGFGLVVTEALLRGVPVLAGAHGGLNEAAASSRYRLPVTPIRKWHTEYDATGMPIAEVEPQPIAAWETALQELLSNPKIYEVERKATMEAARAFASGLKATDLETVLSGLKPKGLRILLIHNSTYYPGSGGGDKSNRLLVEALAEAGHELQVFTRLDQFGGEAHEKFLGELSSRGIEASEWKSFGVHFKLGRSRVQVVTQDTNLRRALNDELETFEPDVIFCSTDDPAHLLYETALQYEAARVIYLVRATIALPFGPDASSTSDERRQRLALADGIVCVSEYVARYCREHGGLDAVHVPISLADQTHPPYVGAHDNEFVTLVNPSAVKGLPILLGLADAMPETQFAAVPSWGTTAADIDAMTARKNIVLLDAVDDITEILKRTRVTVVPSLWAEARSRMVVESLSRGVPVLASDVGGLSEAMCGVEHVLPVNPILNYESKVSDQMVPEAIVPPQNLEPWVAALRGLVESEANWRDLSARGRAAAIAYLESLSVKPLERIVRRAIASRKPRKQSRGESLSPVKRKLLALRLAHYVEQQRRRFFPVRWGTGTKVFLLPWAGAGAQAWSFLRSDAGLCLIPALLPGREDRIEEPPATRFEELIGPLAKELLEQLHPNEEYLIAGHSMGGGLAFEVTREIRRRGGLMPKGLLLSSCTAPASRNATPHPVSAELVDVDRGMFSRHRYSEEVPLPVAITVMQGEEGLSMTEWRRETTREFREETLEGDHFWLNPKAKEFRAALLSLL